MTCQRISISPRRDTDDGGGCGAFGGGGSDAGTALITASGVCSSLDAVIHELGHAFGLLHTYRANLKLISSPYTSVDMVRSFCAAEWLAAHRYFNAPPQNPSSLWNTTTQMLPPSFVSPPNTIRLRFEVADPDGLHQAQLRADVVGDGFLDFLACKRLTGTSRLCRIHHNCLNTGN